MGTRSLDVMIAGEHAGVLSQGESGALSFAYLRGYRGILRKYSVFSVVDEEGSAVTFSSLNQQGRSCESNS